MSDFLKSRLAALITSVLFFSACTIPIQIKVNDYLTTPREITQGLSVDILPVSEVLPSNLGAISQSDSHYLGSILGGMGGPGPVPIIPMIIEFHKYESDISRSEIIRQSVVTSLNRQHIPSIATSDSAANFENKSADQLGIEFRIRDYRLKKKLGFLTVIVISAIGSEDIRPQTRLECRLLKGGQAPGEWNTTSDDMGDKNNRQNISSDLDTEDNPFAEAYISAVGHCLAKLNIATVREQAGSSAFESLFKKATIAQSQNNIANARKLYTSAYAIAISSTQKFEVLSEIGGMEPQLPEEAQSMSERGLASLNLAKTPKDIILASNSLEQAVSMAPWSTSLHLNAARAEETTGKWNEAAMHLKAYLLLKPEASDKDSIRMKIAELTLHQEHGDKPASFQKKSEQ